MAFVGLDNMLGAVVSNTISNSIKMINISELHESADNFFIVENIENFAQTILGQGGVKDNLIVRPLTSGGYEIISGHRRKAAVQYLIEHGENISHKLPCLVQEYADEEDKMLDLILMNVSSRRLSDSELWKCYETIDNIIKAKKEKGEYFGRIRDDIAKNLGISPAQVGKMQNVEKYAIESVKDAVSSGDISISTANEIAKLSEEEQKKIADSGLKDVKPKDVKKKNKVDTNINTKGDMNSADVSKSVDININLDDILNAETQDIDNQSSKTQYIELNTNKVDININSDIISFIEKLHAYTENGQLPKISPAWWSAVNKLYNTEY